MTGVVGVEVSGGFVGEEDGWGGDDRTGNTDPLLFTTREFFREAGGFVLESDHFEGGGEPTIDFGTAVALCPKDKGDIFGDGATGEEFVVLEDDAEGAAQGGEFVAFEGVEVNFVDPDVAAARGIFAIEEFEKGGFARAGGACEKVKVSSENIHGEVAEGFGAVTVSFANVVEADDSIAFGGGGGGFGGVHWVVVLSGCFVGLL